MNNPRWWDLAVAATALLVGGIAVVNAAPENLPGALIVLVLLCGTYYGFGRRLVGAEEQDSPPSIAASVSFQLLLGVLVAVGAAFEPNLLTTQIIVFPLIWVVSLSTRQAVLANIAVALIIAVGFVVGIGDGVAGIPQALFTAGVSVGFSLAIGLWITQIAEYGDERQHLLEDLQAAQGELELMSRDAGATAERERIAREIHDTIAQSLTSVVMLAQRARLEQPTAESTLEMIEFTAREALSETRALVAANAGLPGDDASLGETLHRLAERFRRETGVVVTAHIDAVTLPRDLEVVLLRCAQEGLANVRKHANAGAASVTVEQHADAVTLTIEDDGRGLGELRDSIERGFGLSGMRDRVGLVGGQLTISGAASGSTTGTRLEVTIPLVKEESR